EEQLRESEKQYRELVEKSGIAILIDNIKGEFEYFNNQFTKLFGYTKKELQKLSIKILVHPDDIERVIKNHKDRISGKDGVSQYEFRGIRKDKSIVHLEVSAVTIKDNNSIVGTRSYIWDITERKQTQEALLESEQRYRTLFENMLNGFAYCQMLYKDGKPYDFIYLHVNKAFGELTGLQNVVGKRVTEVIPGIKEATPELFDIYTRVAETGCPEQFEINFTPLDIWLNISVYSQQKDCFAAVFENITERKEAGNKLAKQQYYLTKAQEIGRIGTWELDLIKNELIWTEQNYQNFGVPVGTPLTYEIFLDCVHQDDRNYVNTEWMAAITGKPYDIEHRLVVDGKIRWVREKAEIEFDKDGKALKAIGFTQNITERKRSEELLLSVNAELSMLGQTIETMNETVSITDEEHKFIFVNKAFVRTYGYTKKEILGKTSEKLVSPKTPVSQQKKIRAHTLKGGWRGELFNVKKDGTTFPIELSTTPLKNSKGEIIAHIGIATDITERKQVEEELRQYERIVSTSTDMLALLDKKFIYLAANKAYIGAFNKTPDEIIGHTVTEVFGKEYFNKVIMPNSKRCLNGEEINFQAWIEFPAHGRCYMDVTYYPYYNDDNKIMGFVVNGRDITAHKKAEEDFENIFNVSPDLLAVCTTEGKFLKVNRSWENVLGYNTEKILKLGWAYFVHPDDVERTNAEVQKQLKGSSVVNFTNRFQCKDGSYKTLEWQATYALDGIVHASARDVTVRMKAEENLNKSRNQLRKLARKLELVREEERKKLAGEIHDELGQALTAIQIDLSMLKKKVSKSDKEQQDRIASMIELNTTLTKKVQQMSMDLRPGILDDLGLIPALEWQIGEFQKRTGIKCQLSLESTEINLDQNQSTTIYRIFQEALTNIARHAKATQIKVAFVEQDDNLVLEVTDNGRGITKKQIDNVESLGLVGMRERCLSCDGEMKISGIPGKGTTVTVNIPVG
ncbi:MAG: PAS domain S-box protein, partial [Candidatus Marinimicrobia bacterium]|nr:PAS domain S-box protein [Candidatus Neomarinimicrobiota bacterium]